MDKSDKEDHDLDQVLRRPIRFRWSVPVSMAIRRRAAAELISSEWTQFEMVCEQMVLGDVFRYTNSDGESVPAPDAGILLMIADQLERNAPSPETRREAAEVLRKCVDFIGSVDSVFDTALNTKQPNPQREE